MTLRTPEQPKPRAKTTKDQLRDASSNAASNLTKETEEKDTLANKITANDRLRANIFIKRAQNKSINNDQNITENIEKLKEPINVPHWERIIYAMFLKFIDDNGIKKSVLSNIKIALTRCERYDNDDLYINYFTKYEHHIPNITEG